MFAERKITYQAQMPFKKGLYEHLMSYGYLPDTWVLPPFLEIRQAKTKKTGDGVGRDMVTLYAPKTNLNWRAFGFLNPANYQNICNVLSDPDYMQVIQKLSEGKKILSYSLPQRYSTKSQETKNNIRRWSDLQEDLQLNSSEYSHILLLDISNCYSSMYTHTLEWASKYAGFKGFGERLDKAVRAGMGNKSHGLPVGSTITHYIAEIVLLTIDRKIEENTSVKVFLGGRYRDDYYILCKNEQDAELLLKDIAKCLREYHHDINSEKTQILQVRYYFNNLWRIDFNANLIKLGLKNLKQNERVDIATIESFIGLSLRLSETIKNSGAVVERTLAILEGVKVYRSNNLRFFSLVQRMYQVRTQALPRVLSMLFILSNKDEVCMDAFKNFLNFKLSIAGQSKDEFEILWLVYFMAISNVKSNQIAKVLLKQNSTFSKIMMIYYDEVIKNKLSEKDQFKILWQGGNNSNLIAKYRKPADKASLVKILSIKFSY